ncbi:MAG TPA: exonuclease domain-containing protein [Bacteroidales bacterium]|nr:exonuclease domain-containing protein [Bacteroidales bacterium]
MYAIIDIETTGGNPRRDKITDIAVLIHDGKKVIREYSTLVNPECRIPYHITALTGITNEMVADAPKFYEIARELVEITNNAVFVAHNVSFDYGFLRNEFQRLGFDYRRDKLCTVRLSRRIIPGHPSYSLGRLCNDLSIEINNRHRALGDAQATARLFDILLETECLNGTNHISCTDTLGYLHNPLLNAEKVKNLPEDPGVYYMYNKDGDLIYIGKSRNIRNRVISHFSNKSTSKAMNMQAVVADVDCERTGSELIALLKESYEIKKHKPLFNRRQRRSLFRYELRYFTDEQGYLRFSIEKTTDCDRTPLVCFSTKSEARAFLIKIIEKHLLCQKLCGIYPTVGNCFHYEIGVCNGACIGKEPPELYNIRANKVIMDYNFGIRNMLIIDEGRNSYEKSVIKIENGKYIGYGYFAPSFVEENPLIFHECITHYPDNREVQQIIKQYLRNNRVEKIMVY